MVTPDQAVQALIQANIKFYQNPALKEIPPFFVLYRANHTNEVVRPAEWKGPNDRQRAALHMAVEIFLKEDVYMYAFVSEAWSIRRPPNADMSKEPPPRDAPDRKEIIIITVRHRDGQHRYATQSIVRGESGNVVKLNLDEIINDSNDTRQIISSRFDLWPLVKRLQQS